MRVSRELVDAISQRLEVNEWNQTQFADKVGETRFWVSKLLRMQLKNISEDQILRIEAALDLKLLDLMKPLDRNREVGSDQFVDMLAEQLRSTAPAHKAFIGLFEILRDNQLYDLPELDARVMKGLGEEIHRLSDQAEPDPVAATRVFLSHLQEVLVKERSKIRG